MVTKFNFDNLIMSQLKTRSSVLGLWKLCLYNHLLPRKACKAVVMRLIFLFVNPAGPLKISQLPAFCFSLFITTSNLRKLSTSNTLQNLKDKKLYKLYYNLCISKSPACIKATSKWFIASKTNFVHSHFRKNFLRFSNLAPTGLLS